MTPRSTRRPAADSTASRFEHATLFEFSKIVNATLDLGFILSHVLLTIMGKILSSRGMVLLARGPNLFRVEAVKGFDASLVGQELPVGMLPRSTHAVQAINARRYPWVNFLRQHGVAIIFPLCLGERPIGLLGFGPRLTKRQLSPREVTYLRSLANLAAAAIDKTHIIQQLQQVNRKLDRKIQELNTLFELGKEFGSLLDRDKLVRLVVFSLLGQVGVSRYLIALKEGADIALSASRLDGPAPGPEALATLAREKAPMRVADLLVRGPVDLRGHLREAGLSVVVPLQLNEDPRGVILLGEKLSGEGYADLDLEFLSSLGNLAVIALENARLFREEIEKQKLEDELLIAREIQRGLLPSVLPVLPRIALAATNVSSKQVGGDYYDVLAVDDAHHVVAIGDVSGKGPPAALLMANLQATIRALVPLRLPLGELTWRVNDLMCQNTGGSRFVTFFWGIIDHEAMTFRYVNAGHNYPYLLRDSGGVERLEKGGMILGILPASAPYEEGFVDLRAGDLLLLFTDGVSEAMNRDGVDFGEARLEGVLKTHLGCGPQEILQAVQDDIRRHTQGAPQSDDITMMAVKVLPPPA